jgi:ArsR family transcriptional regulator
LEEVFKALADATRLRIVALLLTGEVCVGDIHQSLEIPQSKASRHLAYLRKARLVAIRREGLWVHYRLALTDERVLGVVERTIAHALTHLPAVQRDRVRLQKLTSHRLSAAD